MRTRLEEAGIRVVQRVSGAQCERLRRTVCAIHQRGVPQPADSDRRAPFPTSGHGIRRTIITSGITRGINSSRGPPSEKRLPAAFADVRGWAVYLTITIARRERPARPSTGTIRASSPHPRSSQMDAPTPSRCVGASSHHHTNRESPSWGRSRDFVDREDERQERISIALCRELLGDEVVTLTLKRLVPTK